MCEFVNSNISPYQAFLVQEFVQKQYNIEPMEWCHHFNQKGVEVLEVMLKKESGHFTFGDTINLSDVYFFPQVSRAFNHYGVKPENFPIVSRVYNNLKEIADFVETSPENQPDYDPKGI